MKLLFVVNPSAGGTDKEPFLKESANICKQHQVDFKVFKTTGKDDDKNLKKTLSAYKPDKVISVGGDGTLLFTAKVLKEKVLNFPLGIIPMGSANGMATELGINSKPSDALLDAIQSNNINGVDMLQVNNKYFALHMGDVGINAHIVKKYEKDESSGMITYIKHFISTVGSVSPFKVKVDANNKTVEKDVYMAAICNGRKYGTGMPINVQGDPTDGLFEIVLIEKINIEALLRAGLAAINEDFFDNPDSVVISTTEAEISFENPELLQLDGETIGEFKQLKVNILPDVIDIIMPDNKKSR